jgi:5-(carboxyamino)imidazole ribonucleotide synthase
MRVGVLGAGQLGRMLALAGYPLGLELRFVDPAQGAPAGQVAEQRVADYDDPAALDWLAECDVVTFEFENVPVATVEALEARARVAPGAKALRTAQDRLREKQAFSELGIPTAPYVAVDDEASLAAAVAELGAPAVLKTRRMGYDGKGQFVIRQPSDVGAAWAAVGGVPLLLEGFVRFSRELSIVAVRGADGATRFYPLVENEHEQGILRKTVAPAPEVSPALQAQAERDARLLLEHLDYVGVMALELFQVGGELLANELAPRVHNSGHWTIEGARTSQFENHLRAVCGLPLGDTAAVGASVMLNAIGKLPDRRAVLAVPGAHLHDYGKEPREGRKVGYVTLTSADEMELGERVEAVRRLL